MIGKLLRAASLLLVYLCVATIISQAIVLGYLAWRWGPDRARLVQALAVLQGIDLLAIHEETRGEQQIVPPEEVSYQQILQERAVATRNLELREQALQNGLDQLGFERGRLTQKRQEYDRLVGTFRAELLAVREGKAADGLTEVSAILENADPLQAKALLLQMLGRDEMNEVVQILRNMEGRRRSKILDEFVTVEEQQKLGEILQRIREGAPEATLAEQTQQQLDHTRPEGT